MPDTDSLVSDLRDSVVKLGTEGNPLTAPAVALGKLGDTAGGVADTAISKARSFANDLGDWAHGYFSKPEPRDIELPSERKKPGKKPITRPRTLSGGSR